MQESQALLSYSITYGFGNCLILFIRSRTAPTLSLQQAAASGNVLPGSRKYFQRLSRHAVSITAAHNRASPVSRSFTITPRSSRPSCCKVHIVLKSNITIIDKAVTARIMLAQKIPSLRVKPQPLSSPAPQGVLLSWSILEGPEQLILHLSYIETPGPPEEEHGKAQGLPS